MASQVASKKKLPQFYLFGIASQEAVFEALLEAIPKGQILEALWQILEAVHEEETASVSGVASSGANCH